MSIGPVGVVEDSEGFRLIYIKYIEGLGSPKATPNLDVKSRGPNHTTIVVIKKYKFFTRKINFIKFITKIGKISIDLKKVEAIVS